MRFDNCFRDFTVGLNSSGWWRDSLSRD